MSLDHATVVQPGDKARLCLKKGKKNPEIIKEQPNTNPTSKNKNTIYYKFNIISSALIADWRREKKVPINLKLDKQK